MKQPFLNEENFFKSNIISDGGMLLKSQEYKIKNFVNEYIDNLIKSMEMPIGTISKGRKKVSKGKWVPAKYRKMSASEFTEAAKKSGKKLKEDPQKIVEWINKESGKFRDWANKYANEHSSNENEKKNILTYLVKEFQLQLMKKFGMGLSPQGT